MNRGASGRVDGWVVDGWTNGCVVGYMDGRKDGFMNRWKEEWTEELISGQIYG